jgi:hypothetical protein
MAYARAGLHEAGPRWVSPPSSAVGGRIVRPRLSCEKRRRHPCRRRPVGLRPRLAAWPLAPGPRADAVLTHRFRPASCRPARGRFSRGGGAPPVWGAARSALRGLSRSAAAGAGPSLAPLAADAPQSGRPLPPSNNNPSHGRQDRRQTSLRPPDQATATDNNNRDVEQLLHRPAVDVQQALRSCPPAVGVKRPF